MGIELGIHVYKSLVVGVLSRRTYIYIFGRERVNSDLISGHLREAAAVTRLEKMVAQGGLTVASSAGMPELPAEETGLTVPLYGLCGYKEAHQIPRRHFSGGKK